MSTSSGSDREAWRHFREHSSDEPGPFSSLAFAHASSRAFDRSYRIAVAERDNTIEAGIVLFENRIGPYRLVSPPPFTAYTPVLRNRPPRESDVHYHRSVIDALLEDLEERYHRLSLLLHPAPRDVRVFTWHDWTVSPLYTYELSLQESGSLRKQWSSSRRYDYRKQHKTYRVREDAQAVDTVVRLCAESYGRSGRSLPGGVDNVRLLVRKLVTEGSARVFTANSRQNEQCEAGTILLTSGKTAYYWIAGSTPGPGMTVLLGSLCEKLHEEGYSSLDLVGANTPSIAEFKRQFGPRLQSYYHVERVVRPELYAWELFRSLR